MRLLDQPGADARRNSSRCSSLQFGLSARAGESKAALLTELEACCASVARAGEITALVIDEAQSLSDELLEEIRLLANTETATEKLLPLVLAGQPELRDRLNEPACVS